MKPSVGLANAARQFLEMCPLAVLRNGLNDLQRYSERISALLHGNLRSAALAHGLEEACQLRAQRLLWLDLRLEGRNCRKSAAGHARRIEGIHLCARIGSVSDR